MAKKLSSVSPRFVWTEDDPAEFLRIMETTFTDMLRKVKTVTDDLAKIVEGTGDPVVVPTYTVATLPTASDWARAIIYVSDETGGANLAFSDGSNWRRVSDRAVVS